MAHLNIGLCCLSCQWSTPNHQSGLNAIFCTRHQIQIHYAAAMLCSDLSHDEFSELADLVQTNSFEPITLYEWISGSTDDQWYSYFPAHDHSIHRLATMEEYAAWTPEMILERIKTNRANRLSGTAT